MSRDAATQDSPRAPRAIGQVGLLLSVAGLLAAVWLLVAGSARGIVESAPLDWPRTSAAGWVCRAVAGMLPGGLHASVALLYGVVGVPVALLSLWLFRDFLRLPDWSVAPDVPTGVKLLGHLARVLGSVAAASCLGLAVLTACCPDSVPPLPARSAPAAAESRSASDVVAGGYDAPRPGLAACYVVGFFGALAVRMLGTAVAEVRRWARPGALLACGAAATGLTVLFIRALPPGWPKVPMASATLALGIVAGLWLLLFLFLVAYFMLPRVVAAFEAHGL